MRDPTSNERLPGEGSSAQEEHVVSTPPSEGLTLWDLAYAVVEEVDEACVGDGRAAELCTRIVARMIRRYVSNMEVIHGEEP